MDALYFWILAAASVIPVVLVERSGLARHRSRRRRTPDVPVPAVSRGPATPLVVAHQVTVSWVGEAMAMSRELVGFQCAYVVADETTGIAGV